MSSRHYPELWMPNKNGIPSMPICDHNVFLVPTLATTLVVLQVTCHDEHPHIEEHPPTAGQTLERRSAPLSGTLGTQSVPAYYSEPVLRIDSASLSSDLDSADVGVDLYASLVIHFPSLQEPDPSPPA